MAVIAKTAEPEAKLSTRVCSAGGEDDVQAAVSAAVSDMATDLRLAWIVTATQSGATSFAVARHRPSSPIVAVTPFVEVARRLSMVWGVRPMVQPLKANTDEMLSDVIDELKKADMVARGERVGVTAGRATREQGGTDTIVVCRVT
jgi:pyruvate kinase